MYRRTLIALVGCGMTSGCLINSSKDNSANTSTGSIRPASEPAVVPNAISCGEVSAHRIMKCYNSVIWGDSEDFALRVNKESIRYGETVNISLTNISDQSVDSGSKHQYNLEVYTESGWEEIRVSTPGTPAPYESIGITHDPGEGFNWELKFTKTSIEGSSAHDKSIKACPGPILGRYRFVFCGTIGNPSIAVAFDLHEPTETTT